MKKISLIVLVLITLIVIFNNRPTHVLTDTGEGSPILKSYLDNLSYKVKPEETIIDQHLKQYREYLEIAR